MAQNLCSVCDDQMSSDERISPVPELVGTNRVPSSTEADAVKRFLVDVDGEVQQLESILSKLITRIDRLKSLADTHRSLLSPARRIFPELLSEIFSWSPGSSTQDPCSELPDSFDPHHGPLLFTQICQSWRQTAISTPKLWSTIRFVIGSQSKANLIDMWLERSKDSDLTIAILDRASSDGRAVALRDLPFNAGGIRRLASQAHRWKSAFLHLPPHTSYKVYWDALSGAKGNIGRLQQLAVSNSRGPLQYAMPDIFTRGPRLTSLTLSHLISGDALPIDGSTVAKFCYGSSAGRGSIQNLPIAECIRAMRRFPNLMDCVLYCDVHSNSIITDITMTKLERLEVNVTCKQTPPPTSDPGTLWRALYLPNLKTLTALSADMAQGMHLLRGQFPDLTARCPMLTTLIIKVASATPEEIIEVLRTTPNVRSLAVALHKNPSSVLTSVSNLPPPSQTPILPRLKIINVAWSASVDSSLTDDLFVAWIQMALSRMDTATVSRRGILETATLKLRPHDSLEPPASLQRIRTSLDKYGPANWDSTISISGVKNPRPGGGIMSVVFSIRKRKTVTAACSPHTTVPTTNPYICAPPNST